MISKNAVVMTQAEYDAAISESFQRGFARGQFEAQSNSEAPGNGASRHEGLSPRGGCADEAVSSADDKPAPTTPEQRETGDDKR